MAVTKTNIISVAISLLGHKPIITLDSEDADDLVIAAEQAFDFLLEASITENTWRFATRITQLSRVASETPPTGFKNVFLLPSGYLGTVRLYPQSYHWEIYENLKIYADFEGDIYLEHTFRPDISRLPSWFTKYFVYEIAAFLALSNAQKPEYYNTLESKRAQQMGLAMAQDAKNRPQNSQAYFPAVDPTNGDGAGNYYGTVD